MIRLLDNAILATDLDCGGFIVRNFGELLPVPPDLVDINDPRMSDPRAMLPASVTDASVNAVAGIDQSKLNLNGNIPTAWLGTGSDQAAQGNLVERIANKGAANGYAGLDSNGLLLSANVTAGIQPGTVNSVDLRMPVQFNVSGNPVKTSGTIAIAYNNAPATAWFGLTDPTSLAPTIPPDYITEMFPVSLIPSLAATKFTTGIFPSVRCPVALGMGVGHLQGITPDTGQYGDPNDYLGRDMVWKPYTNNISYQPGAPPVHITVNYMDSMGQFNVTIRTVLKNSNLFYRINGGTFTQIDPSTSSINITVNSNDFIEAYTARPGYNNSPVASLVVQTPSAFF